MNYNEAKTNFLARCAALLPNSLHATYILDNTADSFPEIHTAEREYVCALDDHATIIAKTNALTDREIAEYLATYVGDAIRADFESDPDDAIQLTQRDVDEIMTFVRAIDPTDSNIAAEARDAIRDNFENVTL